MHAISLHQIFSPSLIRTSTLPNIRSITRPSRSSWFRHLNLFFLDLFHFFLCILYYNRQSKVNTVTLTDGRQVKLLYADGISLCRLQRRSIATVSWVCKASRKRKSGKGKVSDSVLRNSIPHILGILMKKYSLLSVPGNLAELTQKHLTVPNLEKFNDTSPSRFIRPLERRVGVQSPTKVTIYFNPVIFEVRKISLCCRMQMHKQKTLSGKELSI